MSSRLAEASVRLKKTAWPAEDLPLVLGGEDDGAAPAAAADDDVGGDEVKDLWRGRWRLAAPIMMGANWTWWGQREGVRFLAAGKPFFF